MAKNVRRRREPKLYRCNVKVGENEDGSAKRVSYHSSDLLSFVRFLDMKFPTWTYFNVYKCKNDQKVGQFTKYKRPRTKLIIEEFAN